MPSDPSSPLERYAGAIARLFPITVPETSIWTDADAILRVLGELAATGATWTCTPDGREALLRSVSAGEARGTLDLTTDAARYLVHPERLVLESFEGHTLTYLRMTTFPIARTLEVGEHLALAAHNRVRATGTFVWFCSGSPLRRAATDRNYATWEADRLRGFVFSMQETMLAETGQG